MAFLASAIFALLAPITSVVALAVAFQYGTTGISTLIASVVGYGLVTEWHVRKRADAASLLIPVEPSPRRPRPRRIEVSLSGHLRLSSARPVSGPRLGGSIRIGAQAIRESVADPAPLPASHGVAHPPARGERRQSIVFTGDGEYGALAAAALASTGYESRTCTGGDTVLETVREVLPDLVVLDLDMPGQRSGWTLLDLLTLSPDTAHIPIVGLTRDVEAAHRDRAWLRDHSIVLLHKPFGAEDLLTAVRALDLGATDAGWVREYRL